MPKLLQFGIVKRIVPLQLEDLWLEIRLHDLEQVI